MSRSFINIALIFSKNIKKELSEINQMIYLLLSVYNSKKRTESPLYLICNNIIPHSRLFFRKNFSRYDWKRIFKTYMLGQIRKRDFYYSILYICFLIRYYICRINALFFYTRERLNIEILNLLYVLAK